MMDMIEANWPLLLAAFLIGLLVAWFVWRASRRTRVTGETGDVLDEGATPAARNQALIDAPARVEPTPVSVGIDQPEPVQPHVAAARTSIAEPLSAPPTGESPLLRIKGIGPKLAARLGELGVTDIAQIAAWDEAEAKRIDAQLGRFEGRVFRDDWMAQARALENGDTGEYESRFGRLDN